MEKINLTKKWKNLYMADSRIREVVAERGVFICVDAQGDPDGDAFQQAADHLYDVVNALGSRLKKAGRLDFSLSRLEFRWMPAPPRKLKSGRTWRLMLRVPEEVTQADLKEARRAVFACKGLQAWTAKRISWREGRCLQVLHLGASGAVEEVYARLREKAGELGYRVRGEGHEIYMDHPRRTGSNKHRKIIRLPIAWPRPDHARRRA